MSGLLKIVFPLIVIGFNAYASQGTDTVSRASSFSAPSSLAELRAQIAAADAVLFEDGFNRCDIPAFQNILSDDVVMAHDQIGVIEGKEHFIAQVHANICNGSLAKPIRSLDPTTMEVFPLYENGRLYGAVQSGKHSFSVKEGDNDPVLTSRARFVTEWRLDPTGWQLEHTYSFDHLDPSENHPMDADVLDSGFDQLSTIEFMMNAHNVRAQSVAILRGGSVAEVRNYGRQDDQTVASIDTLYNAASLAKPVTALTVLRLAARGDWDLDARLSDYHLDEELVEAPQARRVTTRHILTHSSGLPNWRYLTSDGVLAFLFEPGERFEYSGEGFEWLRQAVEAKTGKTIETLARTLVFEPAGMTSTSYLYPFAEESRLADRYDDAGKRHQTRPHKVANAAANLITTAEDYSRFLAYIAQGGGLPKELAREMISTQIKQTDQINFGLGWSILNLPGESALQHSGSDPGVRSLAILWPESGDGIVILSNSDGAIPTWQLILTELYGQRGWDILSANGR